MRNLISCIGMKERKQSEFTANEMKCFNKTDIAIKMCSM